MSSGEVHRAQRGPDARHDGHGRQLVQAAPTARRTSTRPRRARRGGSVAGSGPCAAAAPRGSPPARAASGPPSAGSSRRPGAPRRPPVRSPRPPRGRRASVATRPGRARHRAGSTGPGPRCGSRAGSAAAAPRRRRRRTPRPAGAGRRPVRSAVGQPRPLRAQRRVDRLGRAHGIPQGEVAEHPVDALDGALPAPRGQPDGRVLPVTRARSWRPRGRRALPTTVITRPAPPPGGTRASVAASTPLQSCAGGVASR